MPWNEYAARLSELAQLSAGPRLDDGADIDLPAWFILPVGGEVRFVPKQDRRQTADRRVVFRGGRRKLDSGR